MAAGYGLWQDCVPSLSFLQPQEAWASRPLLFTMELGFPGDQWTGPALPHPHPHLLLAAAHIGRRGGGWAASWTPAPWPCLPGLGSLGPLLGWEQEAVAALGRGEYPGAANQGACPGQGELNITPL